MQVAFSVAVVLVALSVVADSAEAPVTESTLSQSFERFQQGVQSFVENVGERTKATFYDIHHSEFSNKTRNWIKDNFQKLKKKLKATFSTEESN